jgi:hypothetical protein
MAKVSLEKDKIKFLLVEGVHQKQSIAFARQVTPTSNFIKARWIRRAESVDP